MENEVTDDIVKRAREALDHDYSSGGVFAEIVDAFERQQSEISFSRSRGMSAMLAIARNDNMHLIDELNRLSSENEFLRSRSSPGPITIEEINALPEAKGWWPIRLNNRIVRLIHAAIKYQESKVYK
jgi:hypothetical protein